MNAILGKDEEGVKTLELPDRVEPQEKKSANIVAGERVIVISPYTQINVFLEDEIAKLNKGCEVEIVSESEFREKPYIDVERKEMIGKTPIYIIDFGRITNLTIKPVLDYTLLEKKRADTIIQFLKEGITSLGEDEDVKQGYIEYLSNGDVSLSSGSQIVDYLMERFNRNYTGEKLEAKLKGLGDTCLEDAEVIECIKFGGYSYWAEDKGITTFLPSPNFSTSLEGYHVNDLRGNFQSNDVPVRNYISGLRKDLMAISQDKFKTPGELLVVKKVSNRGFLDTILNKVFPDK